MQKYVIWRLKLIKKISLRDVCKKKKKLWVLILNLNVDPPP